MPAILRPADAREWLLADDVPEHLLKSYPANEMVGYRVTDCVKNRREPVRASFSSPRIFHG
ncbi:MAG: hypothetical protein AAGG65_17720 [Pseudomonadota bacterium]